MDPSKKINFNRMVGKAMGYILDKFEGYGGDVSEDSGTLSITLGGVGEYLFNKQPVAFQLWGSSPLTGPCRFDLLENRWIHKKKQIDLEKYLEQEIKELKKNVNQ